MNLSPVVFECRLYISARDRLAYGLPAEDGPKKVANFTAPGYDDLTDPSFRNLLAAFESLPHQVQVVS